MEHKLNVPKVTLLWHITDAEGVHYHVLLHSKLLRVKHNINYRSGKLASNHVKFGAFLLF